MIASSTDLPSLTDIHLPDSFEFKEDIKTASDALNLCSLLDVPEAFQMILLCSVSLQHTLLMK